MSESTVITRFAPSPTGALHVGGARTALFNYAYARRHGGQFLLRLEDTDRARSTAEAEQGILDDLRWLGLEWDNAGSEPRQSKRSDDGVYESYFQRLKDLGRVIEEDNGAWRFRVQAEGDWTVDDQVLGEVTVPADKVEDFIIRKADGLPTYHFAVVVDDADMGVTHVIRGQEHLNNTAKHMALQRALGLPTPTYAHIPLIFNPDGSKMSKRDKAKAARAAAKEAELSVDNIRAWENTMSELWTDWKYDDIEFPSEELIRNFLDGSSDDLRIARTIARALGLRLPEIDVADFRASGYLPEVLCNYLALLGWNPGGDVEKFDLTFLCERFDFDRVGSSAAKFDREKLAAFNADAIAQMSDEELGLAFAEQLDKAYSKPSPGLRCILTDSAFRERQELMAAPGVGDSGSLRDSVSTITPRPDCFDLAGCALLARAYRERSRTLRDPVEQGRFLFVPDNSYELRPDEEDKKVAKVMKGAAHELLKQLRDRLADLDEGHFGERAHEQIKALAEEWGVGMGKVAQPLRVAISGGTVTPPIDATLDILGKDSTLARIDNCLAASGR